MAVLGAILIWWNDNAIFGAQPETIMFAVFLGMLASIPVVQSVAPGARREREELPAATG